ncbi:tyrosine/serine phosphatase-like protein [Zopfia rhizophila CBS 207.26]|uniref:Tyrosine/serine phosphatase-like protein n=1 Tax=Zopfia rhizophila CBS 207.26 TaxID=1314779 RepID=A0A6A6DZ92_9PEZI|nr:tyrosine/serine phosphatase-like protein [Zopfia rhizophila CBS 207.26]
MGEQYSLLKSIPNFRDVGESVNKIECAKVLKTRLLYRGARPDEASFQDRQRLVKEYGIKSIIDLRTKTEHIEQVQKRDAKIKASAAIRQTNDEVAEPLKIPRITYHEINFNGNAFSRMLISKLSWMDFFRLIGLMLFGYRLDAIKLLAPTMEAKGLIGLAIDSLDVCTYEVEQVFEVLAGEANWPLMIHCTQGKDRTGLTVMLVLFLMGFGVEAVNRDYLLSEPELEPEKEERMKEISSIGLSEHFASCPQNLVAGVHEHIEKKYGGVEGYLEGIGVTKEMRERIKNILLENSEE